MTQDYLPEHGAEFNCATTMKVSVPMFWTLKTSGTCANQALNHNHYSVENKGGYTHFSATLCVCVCVCVYIYIYVKCCTDLDCWKITYWTNKTVLNLMI
jgi:hypothetical protein